MEFPATEWSLLAQATLHGESSAAQALAEFCRRYRAPVVHYISARGVPSSEAEDCAQDFLLHVMEKSTLRRADAARGRFRSFLIGALVRFLHDARQRRTALKRGGGLPPVSVDQENPPTGLPMVAPDDDATFDREWAHRLLELTLEAVRAEYARAGRAEVHAVLRDYLPGSATPPRYDIAAEKLGMTVAAFKTEVHRLRDRFRRLLHREVALTVSSPDQIETEIAYLGQILKRGPD